jgi:hydroxymethylglutaryl-CoA lyase
MTAFRDVTLRDGLQLTGKLLPVETKVALARSLLALGFDSLEIGAMARPELVPPMANTVDLIAALSPAERERCWVWTATPSGVRRAIAAGARNVQYCLSVSDAHNRANVGRDTEASVAALPEAVADAHDAGARIQLILATAFTCPFEGAIDPDRVLRIVTDPRTEGTMSVGVADTLGQAIPREVAALVERVRSEDPYGRELLFHGHDTWGLGVANAIAAVDAGADALDGALAGLGGCPFAPGASGNTASEDLLFALRPAWFTPQTLDELASLGTALLDELGEQGASAAVGAARKTPQNGVFPWALGDPPQPSDP